MKHSVKENPRIAGKPLDNELEAYQWAETHRVLYGGTFSNLIRDGHDLNQVRRTGGTVSLVSQGKAIRVVGGYGCTAGDFAKPMHTEAVKTGYFETPYGKYPKIQILTIAELFAGSKPNIPLIDPTAFKKAAKELTSKQEDLF
jgi:hypothetical protein